MSVILKIREYIEQLPSEEVFAASALREHSSVDNARQILSRLVKAGELQRVGRGLFVKPKISSLNTTGQMPSTAEVIASLSNITGEVIAIYGAEAAQQLQLTTQMPTRPVFYTSGNTRTLRLANRTVELRHANPKRLQLAGTFAGLAISALNYLGKKNTTLHTLQQLHHRVGLKKFKEFQQARKYMPSWLADLCYCYEQEQQSNKKS